MIESFKEIRFKSKALAMISQCNAIVDEYQAQNLRLTLRQLYYQLVSRDLIPNQQKAYKNLSQTVSDARLAGLMDWDAIEDRVRRPRKAGEYDDLDDLVRAALNSYRLPRWKGQSNYVELWVEKDALAGVLEPLANEYHVVLMVNRGYSSQSAMYEAGKRFLSNCEDGQAPVLFYLGDFDPSGEDMVRDIEERLVMFGVEGIRVEKLALTMPQIRRHRPPPNPAKITDPRAAEYIRRHGNSSWEVDALRPELLADLIRNAFAGVVDSDLMDEIKAREEIDKKDLTKATRSIMRKRGA